MEKAKKHSKTDKLHYLIIPRSIILWILANVNQPIKGFEHKTNAQGDRISYEEQVYQSQYQLMLIASEYCRRQASKQHILNVLSKFKSDYSTNHTIH